MKAGVYLLATVAVGGLLYNYEHAVATPGTAAAGAAPAGTVLTAPAAAPRPLRDGVYPGTPSMHEYGVVQVQARVVGGAVTGVDILQSPQGDQRSRMLTDKAVPVLVQETLTAQSAQIQGVSGATLTSDAYKTSLQAAIDAASVMPA